MSTFKPHKTIHIIISPSFHGCSRRPTSLAAPSLGESFGSWGAAFSGLAWQKCRLSQAKCQGNIIRYMGMDQYLLIPFLVG